MFEFRLGKVEPSDRETDRGSQAEQLAERFLTKQGLNLLHRNYRCKTGEIDLVMQHDDLLVFIEVRLRTNPNFGSGAESVSYQKQQRLIRTAQHYLQKHHGHRPPACRFDVVSVSGNQDNDCLWIHHAFEVY